MAASFTLFAKGKEHNFRVVKGVFLNNSKFFALLYQQSVERKKQHMMLISPFDS